MVMHGRSHSRVGVLAEMLKFLFVLLAIFLLGMQLSAQPSAPGIDNFHELDPNVYRGAQPTAEGFKYLAKIGVKTVVNLREQDARSEREKRLVTALGMHYVGVPMTGLTPPSSPDISRILALLEDSKSGPVFVHCRRGADRTGAVIAAYRIDHDHWDNSLALKEAISDGMAFFQLPRQSFIRNFHPLPGIGPAQPVAPASVASSKMPSTPPSGAVASPVP